MVRSNEDVVADSEDEETLPKPPGSLIHTSFTAPSTTSVVTSHKQANMRVVAPPTIESGRRDENAQDPAAPPAAKPRPKPRPKFKGAQTDKNLSTSSAAPGSSIEDAPPPLKESYLGDTSTIDSPLTIADRAKSRVRKSTQNVSATTRYNATSDIIDIPTSSDDELQLLPSSRSKSKTKQPVQKLTKPTYIIEIPDTQPTLPVPTSDIRPFPPSMSSQLPPSDPPSTIPPSTPEPMRVPKAKEVVSPPSSPWQPVRKRKRRNLFEDDVESSHRGMPPPEPPAFFAPSSSSIIPSLGESSTNIDVDDIPQKKARKVGKPKPKPRRNSTKNDLQSDHRSQRAESTEDPDRIVQSPTLPRPASSSIVAPTKSKVKVSKPRKRQVIEPDLGDEEQGVKTGKKRRRKKGDVGDHDEYNNDAAEDLDKPTKSKVKNSRTDKNVKGKGKGRQVVSEDEDERQDDVDQTTSANDHVDGDPSRIDKSDPPSKDQTGEPSIPARDGIAKENTRPAEDEPTTKMTKSNVPLSSSMVKTPSTNFARLNYRHSITNNGKPSSMSELIRKVNSLPGSPCTSSSVSRTYSPMLKSSRSAIRKIAPLHPNRRTPPPLPPKLPPPKKTKKQLELEEKWEEELEDSIEGWACLTNEERDLLRKAKRDKEMGWED